MSWVWVLALVPDGNKQSEAQQMEDSGEKDRGPM